MRTSDAGLALIQEFEGCRLTVYRDSVGVLTIGYGHTGKDVRSGLHISQDEASALLRIDVRSAEDDIHTQIQAPLTQPQFDALVSFVFNLGGGNLHKSTLRKLLNAGDYRAAADEFLKWDRAGGKKLAGLTRRREAERALFLSGTNDA